MSCHMLPLLHTHLLLAVISNATAMLVSVSIPQIFHIVVPPTPTSCSAMLGLFLSMRAAEPRRPATLMSFEGIT